MRKLIAICLSVFFLGCNLAAADQAPLSAELLAKNSMLAAQMPPEWLSCNNASECKEILYNCGKAIAVNEKYSNDAEDKICQTEQCSWLRCTDLASFHSECENHKCAIKYGPSPSQACGNDDDCGLVKYDCNQAGAANVGYLAKYKEKICKEHDCTETNCSAYNQFEHKAVCSFGECTTQYIQGNRPDPDGQKWQDRFMKPKQTGN